MRVCVFVFANGVCACARAHARMRACVRARRRYASWMDTPVFRGYESFYGYLGGSIDYYRKKASNAVNSNSTIIQPFGGGLVFWINTTAG